LIIFAVLGLGLGALISGLGLSIVLSYRGSGLINVAAGAVAMLGAYVFYDLRTAGQLLLPPIPFVPHTIGLGGPWSTLPAFLAAVSVCAATGAAFDLVLLRRLRGGSPLAKLLASLGLMITLQAFVIVRFGSTGQIAPHVLSEAPSEAVNIFGQAVPADRFILTGLVLVTAGLLWAVYRFTRFGVATRAAAEDETKAVLAGLAPRTSSLVNNVLAFVLAGALGVLVAPMTQLDSVTIALSVVPALAAALLAGFTSFSLVAVIGLGLGALGSVITYLSSQSWFPTSDGAAMPGITELVFFAIVILAVVWRGARLPTRGMLKEPSLPPAPEARRIVAPGLTVGLVAIGALLVLPYDLRQGLINSTIGVIVCLSFVVIVGFVGQISLLQPGLAGVAGVIISTLAVHAGIGLPFAPVIAVAAAVVIGTVSAMPALRVRGVNLAIVTLAAAWVLQQFFFANPVLGGGVSGAPVPTPHLFGLNLGSEGHFPINDASPPSPGFGIICVIAAVALGMLVASLRRSGLGTRMLAVRSNERAAAAAGIHVSGVKLTAFAISSGLAGLAGVLYSYNFGSVSSSNFGVVAALAFLIFAYLGGITTVTGAVIGGFLGTQGLSIILVNKAFGVPLNYQILIGGIGLISTIVFNPVGIAGAMSEGWRKYSRRARGDGESPGTTPGSGDVADSGELVRA
jgi:branched-chain amino acid transport system permease protein